MIQAEQMPNMSTTYSHSRRYTRTVASWPEANQQVVHFQALLQPDGVTAGTANHTYVSEKQQSQLKKDTRLEAGLLAETDCSPFVYHKH